MSILLKEKASFSLSPLVLEFIAEYGEKKHQKKSKVVEEAILLLQEKELELAYKEAANDDVDLEQDWEYASFDGLENETW